MMQEPWRCRRQRFGRVDDGALQDGGDSAAGRPWRQAALGGPAASMASGDRCVSRSKSPESSASFFARIRRFNCRSRLGCAVNIEAEPSLCLSTRATTFGVSPM